MALGIFNKLHKGIVKAANGIATAGKWAFNNVVKPVGEVALKVAKPVGQLALKAAAPIGAAIGSVIPGVGTAVGGAAGQLVNTVARGLNVI